MSSSADGLFLKYLKVVKVPLTFLRNPAFLNLPQIFRSWTISLFLFLRRNMWWEGGGESCVGFAVKEEEEEEGGRASFQPGKLLSHSQSIKMRRTFLRGKEGKGRNKKAWDAGKKSFTYSFTVQSGNGWVVGWTWERDGYLQFYGMWAWRHRESASFADFP